MQVFKKRGCRSLHIDFAWKMSNFTGIFWEEFSEMAVFRIVLKVYLFFLYIATLGTSNSFKLWTYYINTVFLTFNHFCYCMMVCSFSVCKVGRILLKHFSMNERVFSHQSWEWQTIKWPQKYIIPFLAISYFLLNFTHCFHAKEWTVDWFVCSTWIRFFKQKLTIASFVWVCLTCACLFTHNKDLDWW